MKTFHFLRTPQPEWVAPITAWLAWLSLRDLSEQTIQLRANHINRLGAEIGIPPWDVTLDDLVTWMGGKPWGPACVRSARSSIRVFYTWAEQTGRVQTSPARDLPSPRLPTPKPRPVPEDGYAAALAAADPRTRIMLRLAGDLGMRRGEVAAVHRDDVIDTPQGPLLRIKGKGRKERVIPISSNLADDLIKHIEASGRNGFAFPSGDGHITPHYIGELCSRVLPATYTMHKLRHRALTQAYRSSKDILLTSKLAGHSSVATTQMYYVAPDYTQMRSVVEQIAS